MYGPALAAGRALATGQMRDRCTITRQATATTDTTTGQVTYNAEVIYGPGLPAEHPGAEGRCRIQQSQTSSGPGSEQTLAAADVRMVSVTLQLPVLASEGVQAGDLVTVTAAAHDPDLVGRTYTVTGESAKTAASSRRLAITEVTG